MIVYITHLTHECGVLGCTGRRAEVSSKSPQLVDRLRHLVPAMSLSADSNGGQAATIGWESSEPVAPLACLPASARGYLAYSPRQRSPVEHGRVDQFYGMSRFLRRTMRRPFWVHAPAALSPLPIYGVSEEQRAGSLGGRQRRLGLEQQEPGWGGPLVELGNP